MASSAMHCDLSRRQEKRDVKFIDLYSGENPSNPHVSKNLCLTHFPKDPNCEICNRCKIQRTPNKRKKNDAPYGSWKLPDNFADLVTTDHMVIAEHDEGYQSREYDKYAVVIQDWKTKWLDAYPVKSKS